MSVASRVLAGIAAELFEASRAVGLTDVQADTYEDAADALMDVLDMWNEEGE